MSQKRAAIYIRVGSPSQTEEAFDHQKYACENHAKSTQLKIVKIYSEVANSTPLSQRPMFQKLLSDSKKGLFDVIIVQRADRIGRDVLDVAIFKQRLTDNGVELVIAEQTKQVAPQDMFANSILEAIIGPLIHRLEEMKEFDSVEI
ncbi:MULTISPECIES: recombinase family protein [unclassified Paenibacillus]|uniref:recombinase family protein n=1 Tax=unclassified Paenibacillus TaxID=185978 RepID=UPI001AE9A873|nr:MULTISPECIES: recombinase family protein [unclassified Paenibacillus]MBP1157691.1 DNA invertase Pin-like site-specific DNA recombinase [Paenibacillus sp. PvP091]MBP1171572.1 DNA invertase Pin-like site-specific DNA recombinase [Paenibacillus sp. PvR098]MBP2437953.1 DNA invertase Pin-like site-specific DNA recombinase [Paenibacillus sp. PvP052]